MKDTMVKLKGPYRKKLNEIVAVRKENCDLVRTNQGVIEQLIEAAHKKECKKD